MPDRVNACQAIEVTLAFTQSKGQKSLEVFKQVSVVI